MNGPSPQIPVPFAPLGSAHLPSLYWLCPGPCTSLLPRGRDTASVEQLPSLVHRWEGLMWEAAYGLVWVECLPQRFMCWCAKTLKWSLGMRSQAPSLEGVDVGLME